ncbi:MAG: D-alanyl-D-alanine carboxypeptidase [Methyloglobulus sp.]|nr:D-alanyl-D-alanine carboxypeptidase [Methyloglobulus sp.]
MKIVKKLLPLLSAAGLLLVSHTAMARHAALLIDAETGSVLYELEANQAWYPASLTKLMTLYMTFSALESGRLRLSDHMTISSNAAHQPTSKLGLKSWDTISVEDAILAIVTRSANDASVVLAERLAGSERQFAIKMTSTAHGLGMYGSHFMNATGLPHDWQTTTAHDMALLAQKIIRNYPQYYSYFGVDSLYFGGRELHSTNKFVAHYPGAEGMKTGYTCGSGYNLVATANQQGKRLIGVVLGGMTSSERYEQMFDMMDIGFSDRYGSYRSKNINTMSKSSIGRPPYQLSCGHRPSSYYSAHNEDSDDDIRPLRYGKKYPHLDRLALLHKPAEHIYSIKGNKTKLTFKPASSKAHERLLDKKNSSSNKKTTKVVVATKSKTRSSTHQPTKNARKATENAHATKSKHHEKSGKTIQLAKASTHGKGYYRPDSKSKTGSSTSKSKHYYNPATPTKAKHTAKRKS